MIRYLHWIEELYFKQKNFVFSFKTLTEISVSCTTLLGISSIISLSTVFLSTGKKQKLKLRWKKSKEC